MTIMIEATSAMLQHEMQQDPPYAPTISQQCLTPSSPIWPDLITHPSLYHICKRPYANRPTAQCRLKAHSSLSPSPAMPPS